MLIVYRRTPLQKGCQESHINDDTRVFGLHALDRDSLQFFVMLSSMSSLLQPSCLTCFGREEEKLFPVPYSHSSHEPYPRYV